jgi:hypothetical protein
VRGFSAVGGGATVGAGAAVGVRVGPRPGDGLGGVTVVTVSGGNWGAADGLGELLGGLGGAVVLGVEGAEVRGGGAPTVAFVDALSPLLMMTAVATAPRATTPPRIAANGRHRPSDDQANSP